MKKWLLLTLLIIFNCDWAFAQKAQPFASYINSSLTFGTLTEFYQSVQISESGEKNTLEFNPLIGASLYFSTRNQFEFQTEIFWVLPRTLENSAAVENLFAFRIDFTHKRFKFLQDQLILRMGTSAMVDIMQGRGGEVQLSNGGQSSTFFLPEQNRTTINNTFDVAIEYLLGPNYSLRTTAIVYQLFASERRALSYTLQLNYYFPKDKAGTQ